MNRRWKIVSFNLFLAVFAVFLTLLIPAQTATAANPTTVSFQGKVVNGNGTNVTDGSYGFVFKLYSASSGGTAVWTESDTVTVTAGVFQVNLGANCPFFTANACNGSTPINFSSSSSVYLGITFNSDPAGEMTPRVQLQSVPYAFYADNSGSLGGRAASGYVQLSPSGQQTGTINISSDGTFGGNLAVTGTYNTNTFNSTTLTFGGAAANAINGASGQTLTIQSQGSGALILQSGTGSVSLGTSTTLTNATGGLSVTSGGSNQTLSLNASGSAKIFIGNSSSGDVEIAGQGTGNVLLGGGSTSTGCTITNLTGALTCSAGITAASGGVTATLGNINATGGTIQTAGTDRITNTGNLTNIGTITAASSAFNVDAGGNITAAATQVPGVTSTTNGASGVLGAASANLKLNTSTAGWTVGDYVQLNDSTCGGLGGICYAKITANNTGTNTLTISPTLKWATAKTVNEYVFPEIGGQEAVSPALTVRYGMGYFINGIAAGNGTTYYTESGIDTALDTFNVANDANVTTLNLGNAATSTINVGGGSTTTVNIGGTGTTTNVTGNLTTSGTGNISAGSGALQGGSLSINSGAFAVNSSGAITAGSANTSLLTAGTLGVARGGTGIASYTTGDMLYASASGTLSQLADIATGNVLISGGIGANPSYGKVVLGTHTTGNYVALLGALTGLGTTGNTGAGSTPTLSVLYGATANTAVQGNTSITVNASTGLSGTGSITLGSGGSVSLSVQYGSTASTAVQGNVTFICPSGTGNLSGTGNTITLGSGGTCNSLTVVNNPTFSGLITGQAGLDVTGNTIVTAGNIAINQTGTGAGILVNRTDGVIGNLKAGAGKVAFLFDSAGTFAISTDTRTNIATGAATGTDLLTVLASGSVGIGASPSYKLDVQGGDINVSGSLRTGGTVRLDASGNLSSIGSISASGLIQGTGGLTISGAAVNLNASSNFPINIGTGTSTGAVSIGGGSNTFALNSTTIDISAAGAITGATGITSTNTVQGGTINATTAYQANGTAGQTVSCTTNNQYLNQIVIKQGIVTGSNGCNGVGLSDQRLKTDITSLNDDVLDKIVAVNPVNFYFDCTNTYFAESNTNCDSAYQTGVIAQQLQQIFPQLVNADSFGYYHVDYNGLAVENLKATAELAHFINSGGDATLHDVTSSGKVTTQHITASGALVIDSGAAASVSIDSGDSAGSVQIGASKAAAVDIAKAGTTTTVKGALVSDGSADFNGSVTMHVSDTSSSFKIDNAGSAGQVGSAIDFSDTSGNGYSKLINSSNFTVTGTGDVTARGSVAAGAFRIVDGTGNNVISFDGNGNANFSGTLNLSSAILGGDLTVGGDVNVAGLSTFQKLATFMAKTIFRQDVEFDGHVTVSKDSAGYAELKTGESTVHVTFTTPYAAVPIVSANLTDGQFALTSVNNVTAQGFDISLKDPATTDTKLSWTAIGVIDPQTAKNPPPVTP